MCKYVNKNDHFVQQFIITNSQQQSNSKMTRSQGGREHPVFAFKTFAAELFISIIHLLISIKMVLAAIFIDINNSFTRPPEDAALPLDVEYADDTDFISTSRSFLDDIERIAPPCLAEWSLTINGSKTERTSISRHVDRIEEEWRMTRKLGSLLGEAEDVARRKQLANVAFRKLWTVWFRRAHISLQLRLRLYASFVIQVLTYNMGTWGLTKADLDRIDTYHRRHLRQIIGVHWPNRISNVALYHRCQCRPISESIVTARWRLFGHVLRLSRCPRPKSYRPLLRRHRSCRLQRSTADIPAHDFVLGPATHWSHTTPACRHRSSPCT